MIQALLFDLDGTLLDSRDAVIDAVARTAELYAPGRFSREDLLARFGESFDDFLEAVAEAGGIPDKAEVMERYFAYVRGNHDKHVRLFPYVREGLEKLRAAGYQLAIVTNKQREFAVAGLEMAEISSLFDAVVAVDDVERGKPSADPVLLALSQIGTRPEEARAGVSSVVLEWYGQEEWLDAVPDYRFADFKAFVIEMLSVKTPGGR
jgi:pyrophosphatase PpaX